MLHSQPIQKSALLACLVAGATTVTSAQQVQFVNSLPGTWIDISGTGTPLNLVDDGEVDITTTISNAVLAAGTVRVGSNGGARFNGTGLELAFTNAALPSNTAFNGHQTLLAFWDDVNTASGTVGNVYWQEVGTTLVVQWNNVGFFNSGANERASFQLQVPSTGPAFAQFLYADVAGFRADNGGSATIGYQAGNGVDDEQWSFNSAGAVTNGTVLSLISAIGGVTIRAGSDFWNTPGLGCTYQDFTATPIPAGFFGPGSQAYTGYVGFVGVPLSGTGLVGGVDTIVERLTDAQLPICPSSDTVDLRIRALSLESFQLIRVEFGTSFSRYRVQGCLSSTFAQPTGSMNIRREHASGGTFDSTLPVIPRLIFTKISGAAGVPSAVLDAGMTITFQNPPSGSGVAGCWGLTDGGLGIPSSVGGLVDHDCDVSTPNVPYPATTTNFFGGVCFPGADCINPGGPAEPMLTREGAILAQHCILPISLPPGNDPYCMCSVDHPAYPPCNNPDPNAGCRNASGTGGLLTPTGTPDVSSDTLTLVASGLPPNAAGMLIQGPNPAMGPLGEGHLCVGGALLRLGVRFSDNVGVASWGYPTQSIAVAGLVPVVGGRRYYQAWYRTPGLPSCPGSGVNLTNARQVVWVP